MSLKAGNDYYKQGLYEEALREYEKIDRDSVLYKQAEFNIEHTKRRINTEGLKQHQSLSLTSNETQVYSNDLSLTSSSNIASLPSNSFNQTSNSLTQVSSNNSTSVLLNGLNQTSSDSLSLESNHSSPSVSVIIPVYNVEPYLRQCLDSVINQTLKDIEIICVDDGSTDNSLNILNEYADKDKRFTVLRQKNSGAGVARNKGLKIADGAYLSFLDSDDFFEPTMLEEMYKKAISVDADICLCGGFIYNNATKERKIAPWFLQEQYVKDLQVFSANILKENIFKVTHLNPSMKIYKRTFVIKNNIKFQNLKTCNDVYFAYTSIMMADRITYVNKAFINYRQNTKTSTTGTRGMFYENIFLAFKQIKADLEKNNIFNNIKEQLYEKFCNHFFYEYQFITKQDKQDFISKAKTLLPNKHYDIFLEKCNEHNNITPRKSLSLKNKTLKVSIIIPVYNVEPYLKQCLNSVINQTLKDIEIICINDGSIDNSLNILREYEKKDKRIIIINQENSGQGVARNRGLDIAKGEYISFVDSDDWIELNTLEELYVKATNTDADMVLFGLQMYQDDKILSAPYYLNNHLIPLNKERAFSYKNIPSAIFQICQPNVCSKFYKSSLIFDNNIHFPNIQFEDVYPCLLLMSLATSIAYINKPFYNYRKNIPTSSTSNKTSFANDIFEVFNKTKKELEKRNLFYFVEKSFWQRYVDSLTWMLNGFTESQVSNKELFIELCKKNLPKEYFTKFLSENKIDIKKISVIIPVYNVEPYLKQCLDSIINQTLKDIEIICINDGSIDNSLNILKEYEKKDKRIIIINQENSGQGVARNKGLDIAKGEYISFVDSDDWIELNTLEELYAKATNTDADIVLFGVQIYQDDKILPAPYYFNTNLIPLNKEGVFSYKNAPNVIFQISKPNVTFKLFSKKLWESNNIRFQSIKFEDVYPYLLLMALAANITYIDKPFYNYRRNISSSTTSNKTSFINNIFEAFNKAKNELERRSLFHFVEKSFWQGYIDSLTWILNGFTENKTSDKEIFIELCKKNLPKEYFSKFLSKNRIYTKKVSVIIPVYNVEPYLGQCLDSVVNQTLKDIEIICVDDGSTDNSLEILKEYEKKDKRFIVLTQKNQRQGAARNIGLDIATAPYIMFVDSDDWLELDILESFYNSMINNNIDIVIGNVLCAIEDTTLSDKANALQKYYNSLQKPNGIYQFDGGFTKYRSAPWCKLFRKDIIDKYNLRFPEKLIQEDEAWHWYYFSVINTVCSINQVFYHRRIHYDSTMVRRDLNNANTLDILYILEYIYNYLQKNKLYEKYYDQYNKYFSLAISGVLKRCNNNYKLVTQANSKIQTLQEIITPSNAVIADNIDMLSTIKNILKNNILINTQFKYNLRIWDNKVVVIDILDMKMAYDITTVGNNITINIVLRKDCNRGLIYKLYPIFPKNKNYTMIYTTPITTIQTSLVDFIKKEIDRVVNQALLIKQVQIA